MRKVVLYARAFCLVMKRRLAKRRQRRQEEREKQLAVWGKEEKRKETPYFYYALGGVAMVAVVCSKVILCRTVSHMQELYATNGADQKVQEMEMTQEAFPMKGALPASIEPKEKEIDEEVAPLAATFIDFDAFTQLSLQEIKGVSAQASSVLQSETDKSYEAVNLLDGDPSTSWQEGEAGNGEGVLLTFQFDKPVAVSGIELINGNGISKDKYLANNRPKEITIQIGNEKVTYSLQDQFGSQYIYLSAVKETQELTLKIDSVYKGSEYDDTCMSDIKFYSE